MSDACEDEVCRLQREREHLEKNRQDTFVSIRNVDAASLTGKGPGSGPGRTKTVVLHNYDEVQRENINKKLFGALSITAALYLVPPLFGISGINLLTAFLRTLW